MALLNINGAGRLSGASGTTTVTVTGLDLSQVKTGMTIHPGSNMALGDGYIIDIVIASGTTGGTLTLLTALSQTYTDAEFLIDTRAFNGDATGYAAASLVRVSNRIASMIGFGTTFSESVRILDLDKPETAGTSKVSFSIGGVQQFAIEHIGDNLLIRSTIDDGVSWADVFQISKAGVMTLPFQTVDLLDPGSMVSVSVADERYAALVHAHAWSEITHKPLVFAPDVHDHLITEVVGLQTELDGKQPVGAYAPAVHDHPWLEITDKPLEFTPAAHGHTIADITALQTTLDEKALLAHTHLWVDIVDVPATFAPSAHTHALLDITGLQAALDGKQNTGSYAADVHTHLWADLTDKPASFAPSAHTHGIADTTGLQTALDGKAAAAHDHLAAEITDLGTHLATAVPPITDALYPQWEGAWIAGTYQRHAIVSHAGGTWLCTAAFTTGEPDVSLDWTALGSAAGAGLFRGNNGATGDTIDGAGDIFRVHGKSLTVNTTIGATENALAAGPLTVASGVTLTVASGGELVIA